MAKKKTLIDMDLFCSANDALKTERSKTLLPVTPALDYRLGGGIAEGSLVLIRSKPKVGKTLCCMEIATNALRQGRWVVYFDTECRMTASKYFHIEGFDILNHPKFLLMNSESGKKKEFIGGERMFGTIINMMKTPKYNGAVYIVDSLSCVITQDTIDDPDVKCDRRDSSPKLIADFLKKCSPHIRMSNSILAMVQHMAVDMSPAGHGRLVALGGSRVEYAVDVVLESKHSPLNLDGESVSSGFAKGENATEGVLVRFDIPANRLLGPYVAKDKDEKIHNYYKFGKGCWKGMEIYNVLTEMGLISKSGAGWSTFMTEKFSDKVQGAEKAAELIENNLEYFEDLIRKYFEEEYSANYNFVPVEGEE